MLILEGVHHIAIICSDYERSKKFYTEVLGLTIIEETFRKERNSYKLDLALHGHYLIELFSFPNPQPRPTQPESTGLRHLAFRVPDVEEASRYLQMNDILPESVRIDPITGKKFCFFRDPDNLPLELYEG